MKFATRMQRLGTETAFEVLVRARALEAQGRDVIHLEIGEPDFDTPRQCHRGRRDALTRVGRTTVPRRGSPTCDRPSPTTSTDSRGTPLRPGKRRRDAGRQADHVLPILALLEEGDDAIYPDPGFPIYRA